MVSITEDLLNNNGTVQCLQPSSIRPVICALLTFSAGDSNEHFIYGCLSPYPEITLDMFTGLCVGILGHAHI